MNERVVEKDRIHFFHTPEDYSLFPHARSDTVAAFAALLHQTFLPVQKHVSCILHRKDTDVVHRNDQGDGHKEFQNSLQVDRC
jgi:hypothetical protein